MAYVDILGYGKSVTDAVLEHRADAYLNTLRGTLDPALAAVAKLNRGARAGVRIKAFSDNIVFAVGIRGDAEDELLLMVKSVAAFQCELALNGFFLRGAIAIGMHHMDKELVFGEAILDAYRQESQVAVNPRVILDGSAVSNLEQHREKYEALASPQSRVLLTDVDSKRFVHYLAALTDPMGGAAPEVRMNVHRDRVARQLQLHAQEPTIWTKYVWVARYHNFCCDAWGLDAGCRLADSVMNMDPRSIG